MYILYDAYSYHAGCVHTLAIFQLGWPLRMGVKHDTWLATAHMGVNHDMTWHGTVAQAVTTVEYNVPACPDCAACNTRLL